MKKIKLMLMFLLVSYSVLAFKMEGINFDKSLENGYREFIIHNDGVKKIRYRIKITPSGKEDVTDNIDVFPKILTIEPKSTQVLKMFGTGKRKLENKEYPFVLNFEQIVIPTLGKSDGKTVAGTSTMSLAPSVQMKGYGGIIDYSKHLEFKNYKFFKDEKGNLKVKGEVVNTSHGAVDVGVNFYNRDKSVLSSIGLGTIPANSTNEVTLDLNSFTSGDEIASLEFYNEAFETLREINLKEK